MFHFLRKKRNDFLKKLVFLGVKFGECGTVEGNFFKVVFLRKISRRGNSFLRLFF